MCPVLHKVKDQNRDQALNGEWEVGVMEQAEAAALQ